MSTLATLNTKLSYALGTPDTKLYTSEKRTEAINQAIQTVIEQYPIPQYITTTSLNFVSGVASLPSDCSRPFRLCVLDSNDKLDKEYILINQNDFDYHTSYTYTIKWDGNSSTEKLYIYPADTVTLSFRYIVQPAALSGDSDTTRFATVWDDGITELAAATLLLNHSYFDKGGQKLQLANAKLAKVWQMMSARYDSPETNRLESVFEKRGFLRNGFNFRDNTNSTTSTTITMTGLTWTTATADTTLAEGYGYYANSASLITFTLPSTASVGDTFRVSGQGAGGWKIAQNAGQSIIFNSSTTTTGTDGYMESTEDNDMVEITCMVANTTFKVEDSNGNPNLV